MLFGGKRYEPQHKRGAQGQPVTPQGVSSCALSSMIESEQPVFRTKQLNFARYTFPFWAELLISGQSVRIICHHHVAHLTMQKSYKNRECSCRSLLSDTKAGIFVLYMDKEPSLLYAQSVSTENFYFAATCSEMRMMPVLFHGNKTGILVSHAIFGMLNVQHPYSSFLAVRRSPSVLGERLLHIAQVPRAQRPPLAGDPATRGPATSSKRRNSQHNLDISNPGGEHGKIAMV